MLTCVLTGVSVLCVRVVAIEAKSLPGVVWQVFGRFVCKAI